MARQKHLVPNEFMIPVGAAATQRLKRCADSWLNSDLEQMRAELPPEYHAVPLDWLKNRWQSIRKIPTDGYKVNGKGPAKGSRIKAKKEKPPKWYRDYIDSPSWKERRKRWLDYWGNRCCLCNTAEALLDVHHRTYVRCPDKEVFTDCIVLCRRCHEEFHYVVAD